MKRTLARVSTVAVLSGLILPLQVLAQSPETRPTFDVADVHVSKPGTEWTNPFLAAGRVEVRGWTMLDLVSLAYQVINERVLSGPPWLSTDRFDITAKAAASTPEDMLRPMLQTLLADRFKLAVRKEERPVPVYLLTVGRRGPKLKESAGGGPSGCNGSGGAGTVMQTCQNMTMAQLTQRLRGMANGYLDHPVVDTTGLTGSYDFTLSWVGPGMVGRSAGGTGSGVSIFDAVDQQLGLKLEGTTQPGTVIVVEHVNQKPTDNPPGVTPVLPPPPTEFEVAVIRVSKPGTTQAGSRLLKSGQLDQPGTTLKDLITFAYDLEDDMVVGAPKWLDSDRFDLSAKAQSSVSLETVRVMLQKLLADRFKLAVHREDQPVSVYALTPGKRNVKLKEADGSNRSDCKLSFVNGNRTYTCQNTTMAQLAEKLRSMAPAYLGDHPVVDLTGLKGAYDFTLSWAGKNRFTAAAPGGGGAGQPPGAVATAADPNGDITVFEAVDRYMGLKLAAQKYPIPVIVIDHVERTPTEN
jgi:uncharacterized protein (TIGR03435 family)